MFQLNFTTNPNGKLLQDIFTDIRPANLLKFTIGNEVAIIYKNKQIGVAVVEASMIVKGNQLKDSHSFINCGHAVFYQHTLLKKFYGTDMTSEDPFIIVTLRYVDRNWDAHSTMMMEEWNKRIERHNAPSKFLINYLPNE